MERKGNYPLPKFHFLVDWGQGFHMGFTECSGLDFETEVIEYREGKEPTYNKSKQPGLTKYSDVTLKRGTFEGDFDFFNQWKLTAQYQENNATGTIFRRTVNINLLNESGNVIINWVLKNAWPSKIQSTDLKADGNEVAIETMVLVHEGLVMNPK